MTALVEFEQVSKLYGDHVALDKVNFTLKKGRVVGLLGPNGAGKSTLMQVALGLLQIDKGSSQLFNHESWQLNSDIKQKIGYVAQQPVFFGWISI